MKYFIILNVVRLFAITVNRDAPTGISSSELGNPVPSAKHTFVFYSSSFLFAILF